jgi:hypothetical protein
LNVPTYSAGHLSFSAIALPNSFPLSQGDAPPPTSSERLLVGQWNGILTFLSGVFILGPIGTEWSGALLAAALVAMIIFLPSWGTGPAEKLAMNFNVGVNDLGTHGGTAS